MADNKLKRVKKPDAGKTKEVDKVTDVEAEVKAPKAEPQVKHEPDSVGADFFKPGAMEDQMSSFAQHMSTPREKIDLPPIAFGDEEGDEYGETNDSPDPENVEQGTAKHFDYDDDHEATAEFFLMAMDSFFSMCAGMYSGQDAEKYTKFSEKNPPSSYQKMVTAAMVKKYQAKMSLEYMFVTVVLMAFIPTASAAHKDRKEMQRLQAIRDEAERARAYSGRINPL